MLALICALIFATLAVLEHGLLQTEQAPSATSATFAVAVVLVKGKGVMHRCLFFCCVAACCPWLGLWRIATSRSTGACIDISNSTVGSTSSGGFKPEAVA